VDHLAIRIDADEDGTVIDDLTGGVGHGDHD
jgi:hypothetical protein